MGPLVLAGLGLGGAVASGLFGQGKKPQNISTGPSRFQQASMVYPGMEQMVANQGDLIQSQLAGQLSPATLAQLQDTGASWGMGSGMPLSGVAQNRWDTSRVNASMGLQQQGIQNSNAFQQALEAGMIDPSLNTEVNAWNSVNSSQPDPTEAYFSHLLGNLGGTLFGSGMQKFADNPSAGTASSFWDTAAKGGGTYNGFAVPGL